MRKDTNCYDPFRGACPFSFASFFHRLGVQYHALPDKASKSVFYQSKIGARRLNSRDPAQ
jgi:hypothetical protein